MNLESTFAESDRGGCMLLPFPLTPNTEDTIAAHLKVNTIFLTVGQSGAPWTGYFVIWRGVKHAIRMYQGVWFEIHYDAGQKAWYAFRVVRDAFNLLHKPTDNINLEELKAQTIVQGEATRNAPVPATTGFASAPQTPAHRDPPTDSTVERQKDESIPGLGINFGEGSSKPDKGKGKDSDSDKTATAPKITIAPRGGGGDPDGDSDERDTEDDRRFRAILESVKGDQLEGKLPEDFDGSRARTKHFLLAFDRYCFLNQGAGIIKNPMKRANLFLTLCKGKSETWADRASEWLKKVRDGDEVPPFGYDVWQVLEREFRDAFTNFADADKAHQELLKLRMKEGRLDEYIGEFQDLVNRAGKDINEPGTLRQFAQGLQGTLAHTCIYQDNPENFRQWVTSAQNNHRNWLKVQALKEYNPFSQPQRRPGQNPFTRRWSNNGGSRPARRDPDAMDVDTIRKATTEVEKQKYRSEGCCFTCGKQGHLSRNCPDRIPRVAATADSTPRIATTVVAPTLTPQITDTIDDDSIRKIAKISMRMTPEQQDLLAKELVANGADFQ
ncbi:hypothetical protein EDB87DRAFT_1616439 [Lactarius vividus]|nr:hypothetical protein EDB87DRAFT_1616439 [Lactarius vividus]